MVEEEKAVKTVLVVEDFEDNRFMMRRLLEMSGYRVIEAVNGQEAVDKAYSERPDLILMDLSLPLGRLAATRAYASMTAWIGAHRRRLAHDTADFHADALAAGRNEYVTSHRLRPARTPPEPPRASRSRSALAFSF